MTEVAATVFLKKLDSYIQESELVIPLEVHEELLSLRDKLRPQIPLLIDAGRELHVWQGYNDPIRHLRDAVYEVEDMVDLTIADILKKRGGRGNFPNKQYSSALQKLSKAIQATSSFQTESIKSGDDQLDVVKFIPGASLSLEADEDGAVGLEDYLKYLTKFVFERGQNLCAIRVVGMPGVGKTFLINKFLKSHEIRWHFDCHAMVSISQFYKPKEVLTSILDQFCQGAAPFALDEMDETSLIQGTLEYLGNKRFMLVLDDVRDDDIWDIISHALPRNSGGRVIYTTHNMLSHPHNIPCDYLYLNVLEGADARQLFCSRLSTESDNPSIMDLYHVVLDLCKGLPLAIITIASAISRTDRTQSTWTKVYQSLIQRIRGDYNRLFEILNYSYKCMPPQLKYAFLYCVLFPKEDEIEVKRLISLWVADGFLATSMTVKDTAMTYLMELIYRGMFQPVRIGLLGIVESIQVHEILRHLASFIIRKGELRELCTSETCSLLRTRKRRISVIRTTFTRCANNSVRSCFVWDVNWLSASLVDLLKAGSLRLLYALDMRHSEITASMLELLGELVHLRYLVLRCTGIVKIPSSFSKLRHLQTFDIRNTQVTHLPRGLMKLENLRSIHLASSFVRKVVEWPLPSSNVPNFKLHVLGGVRATTRLVNQLGQWTQLRKLSLGRVFGSDSEKIFASISGMHFLGSLSIKCDGDETLEMQTLSNSMEDVHTLRVGGRVDQLAHVVRCFPSLCRLYLWDNYIKQEDPFSVLQNLENLVVLCLTNTYTGKEMICEPHGFLNLRSLSVLCMINLETFRVAKGGMPKLKSLVIGHCKNLKVEQFECLEHLPSIELVKIPNMKNEFTEAVKTKVKHLSCKVHETPLFVYDSNRRREDEGQVLGEGPREEADEGPGEEEDEGRGEDYVGRREEPEEEIREWIFQKEGRSQDEEEDDVHSPTMPPPPPPPPLLSPLTRASSMPDLSSLLRRTLPPPPTLLPLPSSNTSWNFFFPDLSNSPSQKRENEGYVLGEGPGEQEDEQRGEEYVGRREEEDEIREWFQKEGRSVDEKEDIPYSPPPPPLPPLAPPLHIFSSLPPRTLPPPPTLLPLSSSKPSWDYMFHDADVPSPRLDEVNTEEENVARKQVDDNGRGQVEDNNSPSRRREDEGHVLAEEGTGEEGDKGREKDYVGRKEEEDEIREWFFQKQGRREDEEEEDIPDSPPPPPLPPLSPPLPIFSSSELSWDHFFPSQRNEDEESTQEVSGPRLDEVITKENEARRQVEDNGRRQVEDNGRGQVENDYKDQEEGEITECKE